MNFCIRTGSIYIHMNIYIYIYVYVYTNHMYTYIVSSNIRTHGPRTERSHTALSLIQRSALLGGRMGRCTPAHGRGILRLHPHFQPDAFH